MQSNTPVPVFSVGADLKNWLIDIRRHIHSNPELSFQEYETAAFVQQKLNEIGIVSEAIAETTGVSASLSGEKVGKAVALRADMDALPITEETDLEFRSKNIGVMHACGHDGHVAMLLGAAALLRSRELPGMVKLIFQPAEEYGNGALHLVDSGILDDVEAVFAGHIDTHLPVGTMTVDEGIVCAWADPFQIHLHGRSGHAARPHEAVDTVVAAANLIVAVQTIVSRGVDPNRSAVISIGTVHAGTAQNIIAQDALLKGTVRSTHCKTRKTTLEKLKRVVDSICIMHGVEATLDFHNCIPAVDNTRDTAENAGKAAHLVEEVSSVISQGASSLGAEDFAFYQQKVPGCMVRFGASLGARAGVSHSGTFDFDEDVLAIGASWYATAAWLWLQRQRSDKIG
jgi:amidohydrolase